VKFNLSKRQKYSLAFVLTLLFSIGLYFFQEDIAQLKSFGLIGLFIISIIGGLLFFPSPIIIASVLAAGRFYPPLVVALIASLGSSIGDILGYWVGYTGREAFIDDKKIKNQIMEDLFHKFGGALVLLLSLIPNPFFDAIGVVAGLFKYPIKKFFIYVFAGRLVRNIILAYLGSAL
jgi:membrane protein YqaA with SNARE-associated domain